MSTSKQGQWFGLLSKCQWDCLLLVKHEESQSVIISIQFSICKFKYQCQNVVRSQVCTIVQAQRCTGSLPHAAQGWSAQFLPWPSNRSIVRTSLRTWLRTWQVAVSLSELFKCTIQRRPKVLSRGAVPQRFCGPPFCQEASSSGPQRVNHVKHHY